MVIRLAYGPADVTATHCLLVSPFKNAIKCVSVEFLIFIL